MERVLSQEEISALFSAMSSREGVVEYPPKERPARAVPAENDAEPIPSEQDTDSVTELILSLPIPMSGEFRGSKLTMNDLLRISVGDVIRLKDRVGDPMVLCIGGIPKFTGRILRRRGKKVFSISGRTDETKSYS
jgi:flagellar motor switch protein FliM